MFCKRSLQSTTLLCPKNWLLIWFNGRQAPSHLILSKNKKETNQKINVIDHLLQSQISLVLTSDSTLCFECLPPLSPLSLFVIICFFSFHDVVIFVSWFQRSQTLIYFHFSLFDLYCCLVFVVCLLFVAVQSNGNPILCFKLQAGKRMDSIQIQSNQIHSNTWQIASFQVPRFSEYRQIEKLVIKQSIWVLTDQSKLDGDLRNNQKNQNKTKRINKTNSKTQNTKQNNSTTKVSQRDWLYWLIVLIDLIWFDLIWWWISHDREDGCEDGCVDDDVMWWPLVVMAMVRGGRREIDEEGTGFVREVDMWFSSGKEGWMIDKLRRHEWILNEMKDIELNWIEINWIELD